MRGRNLALFGLLLLLLVVAAYRLTILTAACNGAGQPSLALDRDPTARSFPQLQVGALAPDAPLLDRDGAEYALSCFPGHKLLVAFFCDSPRCVRYAAQWERIHREAPDLIVLGVSTRGPQCISGFRQETGVTFPLLFDPNYHFASPNDRVTCPRSAVIGEDGRVVYLSDRSGDLQASFDALRRHLRLSHNPHASPSRR
jgi:peroxiredoxin